MESWARAREGACASGSGAWLEREQERGGKLEWGEAGTCGGRIGLRTRLRPLTHSPHRPVRNSAEAKALGFLRGPASISRHSSGGYP